MLTTAYLPPVEYVAAIAEGMSLSKDGIIPSVVYIEACEHYQKQSWRNRARILSSNGPENLNYPIVHRDGSHNGILISELEIDWSTDWLDRHEKAIVSAYSSSAFFEYYRDGLFAVMESRPKTVFEYNMKLLQWILDTVGIKADIRFTSDYGVAPESVQDLREVIHPKRQNTVLRDLGLEKPYFQVFTPKYGFTPNLSVLDLIFNEGPDSITYLKKL